jgi:hypothetical protein
LGRTQDLSRFFLHTTTALVAAFATVNAIAIAAGNTRLANPAVAGFTVGCHEIEQPCWYGILPGITNGNEAWDLMEQAGYQLVSIAPSRYGDEAHIYTQIDTPLCQTELLYNPASQRIQRIQLACDDLRLGDLGSAKGMPTGVQKTSGYAARLLFSGNISAVNTTHKDLTSLYSVIPLIDLSPLSARATSEATFGWHGLVLEWRYCHLEPAAPVCASPQVD